MDVNQSIVNLLRAKQKEGAKSEFTEYREALSTIVDNA